jgi:mannose/fructose-specific phosphotransferase system component IIA
MLNAFPACPKCRGEMRLHSIQHVVGPQKKYRTVRVFQCECERLVAQEATELNRDETQEAA